jgi:hypothetical protein
MQIGAYNLRDIDGINEIGMVAACTGGQVTVVPYSSPFNNPGVYVTIGKGHTKKVESLFAAECAMKDARLPSWPAALFDNLDMELRRFIQ